MASRFEFNTIADIVKHVGRQFAHMVYIGKDYTVADLCRDLERIESGDELPGPEVDAFGALPNTKIGSYDDV